MSENEDRSEGRISENGENFVLQPVGEHIRGGLNLTLSNLRHNVEMDAVHRRDVANLLDSWIVDLQTALRYLKSGNERDFYRAYQSVNKSMIKVFFTITTAEERKVYREGKIL